MGPNILTFKKTLPKRKYEHLFERVGNQKAGTQLNYRVSFCFQM